MVVGHQVPNEFPTIQKKLQEAFEATFKKFNTSLELSACFPPCNEEGGELGEDEYLYDFVRCNPRPLIHALFRKCFLLPDFALAMLDKDYPAPSNWDLSAWAELSRTKTVTLGLQVLEQLERNKIPLFLNSLPLPQFILFKKAFEAFEDSNY